MGRTGARHRPPGGPLDPVRAPPRRRSVGLRSGRVAFRSCTIVSGDDTAVPTVADLVRRYVTEVWNGGNTALLRDLATADHIRHGPDGDLYGPEGFAIAIAEYHAALRGL